MSSPKCCRCGLGLSQKHRVGEDHSGEMRLYESLFGPLCTGCVRRGLRTGTEHDESSKGNLID